ncbi:MAG: tRNA uridine-5-carboxymethylaminomethyl(34) synthesis GTPase MnmE [Alphaproteobacteria bacterium]
MADDRQAAVPTPARDTVFALSSAAGRAGIAVFRISGPAADRTLEALTRRPVPQERRVVVRTLFGNRNAGGIDDVLVLRFVPPRSYTGENVVELHTHGGRATIAAVLGLLASQPGLRHAEPGEFTRRAVENGRLDLTQAEAIADLVNAETEAQRRQALRQFEGALGRLYENWRGRLIRAAAWIEASIDFPDEDVPPTALSESRLQISELLNEIETHLADARRGEILRDGLHVAVIGPPNAGKSSLVNALAQRDVAIVSETAGTTRDVIEVKLDLDGYPVILADTAGLREAKDAIEAEGVRRAEARAKSADVTLLVLDSAVGSSSEVESEAERTAEIVVWNKSDIASEKRDGLVISAKTGEGLRELISRLTCKAKELAGVREAPVLTRTRHRRELESAVKSLHSALANFSQTELAAEEMRRALQAIGRVTGRVDLEELLDSVFRDFCIGK